MKYSEIRKFSPRKPTDSLADALCMTISPFFTDIFIRKHIRPNTVTLFMIISGITGSILLMIPSFVFKCLGIVCLLLWYVMDCSDGEIARITKQFSKHGKEMDYMAHLICHPLFVVALWSNFLQLGKYDMNQVSILLILFISNELIYRNFISFDTYVNSKVVILNLKTPLSIKGNLFSKIKYCIAQFLVFPNIVIFYPIFLLLDFCSIINSFSILLLIISINIVVGIISTTRRVIYFYK